MTSGISSFKISHDVGVIDTAKFNAVNDKKLLAMKKLEPYLNTKIPQNSI